ncbi:MAG: hypothetical protein Q9195_003997 [Heterodermia aff. obscurata]
MSSSGKCDSRRVQQSEKEEPQIEAKYEIGFDIVNFGVKKPIHETIAIAAMIKSEMHFPSNVRYKILNQQQWEYFRGLIWNDDPSCLLLNNSVGNNHDFGYGIEFYKAFTEGPQNCMTKRSHFGNLQFLHAMATHAGEPAQTTKNKLMSWLEVMYKLACGNQGISPTDKLSARFPQDFDNTTVPNGDATIRDLILATTPSYGWVKIERRALGFCMHVIQDSFAIGHTQRRLLNCQDLMLRDKHGFFHFKKGTYGRYGSIIAFHTYGGQDEPRHSHYDTTDGDLPLPRNLDSFNGVLGARDAIEASTKIINFVVAKTKWDEGVRQFLSDEVFALDEKVQPGNTQVDPDPLCANTLSLQEKPTYTSQEIGKLSPFESIHGNLEGEYLDHANIATKLNLLENGSGEINGSKHVIGNWIPPSICIRRWFQCNWLEPASFSLGGFVRLCLILGMTLCGLLLLWLRAETFRR